MINCHVSAFRPQTPDTKILCDNFLDKNIKSNFANVIFAYNSAPWWSYWLALTHLCFLRMVSHVYVASLVFDTLKHPYIMFDILFGRLI